MRIGDGVDEVLAGRNGEIGWGAGKLTRTATYRAYAFGITWPLKLHGGEGKGSV
jgi:hypothetical protein